MKKVLVLSVVAIAILAVASFASLSLSGDGVVQWTYSASPTSFGVSNSTWSLQVTGSGTGYSYTANLNPYSLSSFYFTLSLMNNVSLVTGYEDNFGETVFGGTNFSVNAPTTNNSGEQDFGYSYPPLSENYIGLQYTSSMFNAYVQTTGLSATSVSAFADAAVGPAHVYFGAYPDYTSLYAGASASMGPATLFGLLNYASGAVSSYTVGAATNMGSNQLGLEYSNGNNLFAWFDYGSNVEVNASLSNGNLSNVSLQGFKTIVGGVEGELQVSYSPSSSVSVTSTLYTSF
jgi:hypothetical protein